VSDPSRPEDGDAPPPHCSDACLLVRLGFSRGDRSELEAVAARPEARSEVEHAIARRALADRITAVTALAAGVAHELNNPLAYVTANIGFLVEKSSRIVELLAGAPHTPEDVELASQVSEALRETRAGAERMRAVVRDLATFARPEEDQPRPIDLRPILDSCLNVAWPEIRRRGARLVRDLEPLAPVLGDPGRLSQVFLNLVLNAAQSIPDGHPGEHEIRVLSRTLCDGRVSVEVHDTGAGIAPEHLPRIFDPFFTTREPGAGTGLGLSICHAVVAAMGGAIEVDTVVGQGSRFRVLLAGLAPDAARRAGLPTPPPTPGRARVLVVDDEPLVGTMLRRTLTAHDVTVVHDARSALDRIVAGERFDVVLADLLMPGMSGMELHRTVSQLHPGLARRFLFLTGGAFTPEAREFLETEGVEWFEKPFDVATLRAAVARRVAPARPASA
jgi:signal transduction histidine kinase/ActR/RegA family two-component response regulator